MKNAEVDVVLAVYNGSKYLKQFLNSLKDQSHCDWNLIVRDDASIDDSIEVIGDWGASNLRCNFIDCAPGNLGVMENFSILLSKSEAKYVMLADQDDIWYPEKIEKSLAAIRILENDSNGSIWPALVFSDLHVVDNDLNITHPSFNRMQGLEQLRNPSFRQLLTQNVAPGCTMIVNRALLELALPIPVEAAMHDWWLIQVGSLFGRIGYIDEPTMAYRQHGGNMVGATSRGVVAVMQDILKGGSVYRGRLLQAQLQASALIERYADAMDKSAFDAASTFANLSDHPPLLRQIAAWRHGLKKSGFLRTAGFYFLM